MRQAELPTIILLLVTSGQGVAALPDWVMRHTPHSRSLVTRPLGEAGLHRTLYAALRSGDPELDYLRDFCAFTGEHHAAARAASLGPE